ncbi:hypothetical protein NIES4071_102830 (plasmid) [Calothrix sp. NIES-4071]|nr:hypothetical protein NIES4071_102830 [Calothrix sp. NIES-4071]BAZ64664.1 hypothetical protein NIES4105_103970 [Calothrix sp. NIES-4105]
MPKIRLSDINEVCPKDEMAKKPETLSEYIQDRDSHPNRGRVNGEPVVTPGSVEVRGKIPKPLYNKMIYMTRSLTLGKGDAALIGACEVIERLSSQDTENFIKWKWQTITYNGEYRLFRGVIPAGLHETLVNILEENEYSSSDIATIVVSCFIDKNKAVFNRRIQFLKEKFNVSEEDIYDALAGDAKQLARNKKITILEAGGTLSDIDMEKMD